MDDGGRKAYGEAMSCDPLPALVQIREMVDVKHQNDRLAISAIAEAEGVLTDGGSAHVAMIGVRNTRDLLIDLDRVDAAAACDLALRELAR